MTIYTVCQTNVISVSPHTTISFVADLMKGKNIGCVVITEDHKPVGIVTDRDLALRAECSPEGKETAPVSTIMTTQVQTIRKDTSIFDAIQVMKSMRVRRLPIVDMGGGWSDLSRLMISSASLPVNLVKLPGSSGAKVHVSDPELSGRARKGYPVS